MHHYGGLALWDYTFGISFLDIDMNPPTVYRMKTSPHKDAMLCFPHRLVGGLGSTPILIVKKELFQKFPSCGGEEEIDKYRNNARKGDSRKAEPTVSFIRTGLAFQLRQSIGIENIQKREEYLVRKAIHSLQSNTNIILLGSKTSPRVPVFSFCVKQQDTEKILHHNFIAALLHDLFGIQATGRCMNVDEETCSENSLGLQVDEGD